MKLSETLDPKDALAIDVMYHPSCWRDNVDHVLLSGADVTVDDHADVTGSFSGKGKRTWWNAFEKANTDVLLALGRLGHTETLEEETMLNRKNRLFKNYKRHGY